MINNLPTMQYHFFETPNKITICDESYKLIAISETEFTFDHNFTLDAKSFEMLKKLNDNRKIELNNNNIIITSNQGIYKCVNLNKTKPQLNIDDIIYENNYNVKQLKNACLFVSNNKSRIELNGVIFTNQGEIFGTDSVRMYCENLSNEKYSRIWSIPTDFIKLLNEDNVKLQFTETKILAQLNDYVLCSSIYANQCPDIKKIFNTILDKYVIFNKTNQLNIFDGLDCNLNVKNNQISIILNDDVNLFTIDYKCENNVNFDVKLNADFFIKSLDLFENDEIKIETNDRFIKINNKVVIACKN